MIRDEEEIQEMAERAFYSIIQYCPDAFRAESVNVGLVLLEEKQQNKCGVTTDLSRVTKLFDMTSDDLVNLRVSLQGFLNQFEYSPEMLTEAELTHFVNTRANDLRMTQPRLAKIKDFNVDFERLFRQLVDDPKAQILK